MAQNFDMQGKKWHRKKWHIFHTIEKMAHAHTQLLQLFLVTTTAFTSHHSKLSYKTDCYEIWNIF